MKNRNEPVNHHIEIDTSYGAPRLVLVCTATPGSDCRKRPTDDREAWQIEDPDLVDGECWAAEWIEAAGWDDIVRALDDTPWPRIPVTVHYDEGVNVAPIPPRHETPDVAELRRLLDAARAGVESITATLDESRTIGPIHPDCDLED